MEEEGVIPEAPARAVAREAPGTVEWNPGSYSTSVKEALSSSIWTMGTEMLHVDELSRGVAAWLG
jgi:hypothetical protein